MDELERLEIEAEVRLHTLREVRAVLAARGAGAPPAGAAGPPPAVQVAPRLGEPAAGEAPSGQNGHCTVQAAGVRVAGPSGQEEPPLAGRLARYLAGRDSLQASVRQAAAALGTTAGELRQLDGDPRFLFEGRDVSLVGPGRGADGDEGPTPDELLEQLRERPNRTAEEWRRLVAARIREHGVQTRTAIETALGMSQSVFARAVQGHPWFACEEKLWRLTPAGNNEAFEE